jgi:hypothetical protein
MYMVLALAHSRSNGSGIVMTQEGEYVGLNVHVMCKYICNRVSLIVKWPYV